MGDKRGGGDRLRGSFAVRGVFQAGGGYSMVGISSFYLAPA